MYSTTITISQWKTFFVGKEILHKMMKIALLYFILFYFVGHFSSPRDVWLKWMGLLN